MILDTEDQRVLLLEVLRTIKISGTMEELVLFMKKLEELAWSIENAPIKSRLQEE
jgi:hypothetical protein